MSANIKNIQKEVFERFTKHSIIERCIVPLSEEEFETLESTKGISSIFYGEYGFILLETREGLFVAITSPQECNLENTDLISDFDCRDVTAPYWLASVYNGGLNIRKGIKDIEIKDLIDTGNTAKCIDYEFESLTPFFNNVAILKYKDILSADVDPIIFLKKVAVLFFIEYDQAHHLAFAQNTIVNYKSFYNIINLDHRAYPLDNIIRSLLATEWRFCYLDLYRCIERLFPVKQFTETLDLLDKGVTNEELLKRFIFSRSTELSQLNSICLNVKSKKKDVFDSILGVKVEDVKVEDSKAGDVRAGNGKVENTKTEDVKVEDVEAGDVEVKDSKAEEVKVEDAKAGDVEAGDVEVKDSKAEEVKVEDAKAGDVEAGDVEVKDSKAEEVKVEDVKEGDGDEEDGKKSSKAANAIYERRNKIAHDQVTDFQFKDEKEANDYICVLLTIMIESYPEYQKYLKKIYPTGDKAREKYKTVPLP